MHGTPSSTAARIEFVPDVAPEANKKGSAKTLDVDITCVRSVTHEAACGTYACQETVIWTCTVSGGGGGAPPSGPGSGNGAPGGGSGGYGGGGGGGGASGGGGSNGSIPNEQYDDGSGNGYGGYGTTNEPTFATLAAQWDVNPLAILKPCPGLTDAWKPLIAFVPPAVVTDKLSNLTAAQKEAIGMGKGSVPGGSTAYTWQVQSIQNAAGTAVNPDYFPIDIPVLPIINGQRLTAEQFMEYVRLNINSFIDPGQPMFSPCPEIPGSGPDWQNHTLGTIMDISIFPDAGSVILSKYTANEWDFSTIHEPFRFNGAHPVSGTRAFGCIPAASGSGATFYIRGADRINYTAMELLGEIRAGTTSPAKAFQFIKGDELWNSLEANIALFINKHGGSATVKTPVTNRPDWAAVLAALENSAPLAGVPCPN